jgi:heme A synthase
MLVYYTNIIRDLWSTKHKISSVLCTMFWNALHFHRFPIQIVHHYTIHYSTAVLISHHLHRTLYHMTQGGDPLQIKKQTGCLCDTATSATVHHAHRTFNYAYNILLYFTFYEQLWKLLSHSKCIKLYYILNILVYALPDNSGLPSKTCRVFTVTGPVIENSSF